MKGRVEQEAALRTGIDGHLRSKEVSIPGL